MPTERRERKVILGVGRVETEDTQAYPAAP